MPKTVVKLFFFLNKVTWHKILLMWYYRVNWWATVSEWMKHKLRKTITDRKNNYKYPLLRCCCDLYISLINGYSFELLCFWLKYIIQICHSLTPGSQRVQKPHFSAVLCQPLWITNQWEWSHQTLGNNYQKWLRGEPSLYSIKDTPWVYQLTGLSISVLCLTPWPLEVRQ